ncbi:MAG: SPFH domain-containing protein [Ruminococcus sp.]|nr:SPFH domain-containing protein [Ruminococcus sp.]
MGIFNKNEGGLMDVIRCDEQDYLMWKWSPCGRAGSSHKENAIRKGSRISVKSGSVAVFVYSQGNGIEQEYISGPVDTKLDTLNLPILSNLLSLLYNGSSPYRAEVYFINLAKIIQVKFAVPFFDIYDSCYPEYGVPVAVRGAFNFHIPSGENGYKRFIELHRMDNFDINSFTEQVKYSVTSRVKSAVINAPANYGVPMLHVEGLIGKIRDEVFNELQPLFNAEYGVVLSALEINAIELDKTSEGYSQLMYITRNQNNARVRAQTEIDIQNMRDTQRINAEHYEDTLRRQREEDQYARRMNTQSNNFAAHQVNRQADIAYAAADSFASMGSAGDGCGSPMGMMAGMMMGEAMSQNMANAMNNAMNTQSMNNEVPPPIPTVKYHIAINGQDAGEFDLQTISQMAADGRINRHTLVWKQGMANWVEAGTVFELQGMFASGGVPPIP